MTISDLVREPTETMDRVVKQLNQSRIPIVRVRWNCRISSPFHQYVFRDQHKLNFGTKFLLEGKTVTTHHFRSFPKLWKNTIHHFTIHHFLCPFDILRSIKKFYYSQNTIHFRKKFHYSRALLISS